MNDQLMICNQPGCTWSTWRDDAYAQHMVHVHKVALPHRARYADALRKVLKDETYSEHWSVGPNGGFRLRISISGDSISYDLLAKVSLALSTTLIDIEHEPGHPLSEVTPDLGTGDVVLNVRWF